MPFALCHHWWQSREMRFAKWLGGAVWIGSWYLMYLEIRRWHHVKPSLAFNSDRPLGLASGRVRGSR